MAQAEKHDKTECRLEFLAQKQFYRYVTIAIVTCLTSLGGGATWALSFSSDQGALKQNVANHESRIANVERMSAERHNQIIEILNKIDNKVNR